MSPARAQSRVETSQARIGVGRADVARRLLQPHRLRSSIALSRQPSLRNAALAGLQAAVTMAIALPLVQLSPWPHLIGFAALGALVALFGRFAPRRRRNRIVLFCGLWQVGAVLVMSAASWLGLPHAMSLALLSLSCGVFFFAATTGQFGPPGALIFAFAAGASLGPVGSGREVVERVAATASVAALAWGICAATEFFRHTPTPERPLPTEPLRPASHRLIAAVRIAFGAAIAVFAAHAVGAAHPAWAAMGAVAVMQGAHLHISMDRALQRMAGTVAGAVLAWLILAQVPSLWTVIAVLAALQFAIEVIIGANYALGQILVTPMALLASYLAAPHAAGVAMVPERIVDTMLGVGIGLIVAILCSTLDDRIHLADQQAAWPGA